MLPAAEEVAQEGRATGHYPHSPALLEDSGCRPRNPIPPETRRPSPFCHARDGERASLPAFPSAGPSSHRVSDTTRSLSTNSAGLQGVSRRGVYHGTVRPLRAPGSGVDWSPVVTNLGTQIVTSCPPERNGKPPHSTANQRMAPIPHL